MKINVRPSAEEMAQQAERSDLHTLAAQIVTAIAAIDADLTAWDGYTAAQVKVVVKQTLQRQRAILKTFKFVVRRLL